MPLTGSGPVVFIGLMATGKSAVGSRLAVKQGWRFIDTDQLIVQRHGRISDLFARGGEAAFRAIEAGVVAEVLSAAPDDLVVSLGGGAVLDPATRALLGDTRVVFLDADLETVQHRITGDRARPLLSGDPSGNWTRMDQQRRPVYVSLADLVLDTRGRTIDQLVTELGTQLHPTQEKGKTTHGA